MALNVNIFGAEIRGNRKELNCFYLPESIIEKLRRQELVTQEYWKAHTVYDDFDLDFYQEGDVKNDESDELIPRLPKIYAPHERRHDIAIARVKSVVNELDELENAPRAAKMRGKVDVDICERRWGQFLPTHQSWKNGRSAQFNGRRAFKKRPREKIMELQPKPSEKVLELIREASREMRIAALVRELNDLLYCD